VQALHEQIARAVVLYCAIVGVWGLFMALRRIPVGPAYRGALVICAGLGVVQILVGLVLVAMGRSPATPLHYLYGVSILATLPLVRQYLAGRIAPPLAYGLGSLFMMGLAIRAITTA
jgi:heme A synthase